MSKLISSKTVIATVLIAALGVGSLEAHALPFNDDMVQSKHKGKHMYYSTGEIMRAKPDGSVAIGSSKLNGSVKTKEEAAALQNPKKTDAESWKVGQRLFQINCSPCHGNIESHPWTPGPVAEKFATPPDITGDNGKPYKSGWTDGEFYGVIHFGGMAVMPSYGWKLSPDEHWDIINYVRHVQNNKQQQGK